jgi:glyoxylase-like metal-dependent hydrolase (beta-lactamase superfamily II)
MSVEYCVVSIGALSRNRLWGESAAVRTSHATTTAIFDGDRVILVDPSLPAQALGPVFNERTGKRLGDVTDVFCTTLRPVHRRSIESLGQAAWWAHADELETYREHLQGLLDSAERLDADDARNVEADLKLLSRFRAAPERFGPQTTVYPLAGPSPGSAGVLLTPPMTTIVIAGDAAVTAEHVRRGQVWEGCADIGAAMRTMADFLELADVIVPGHDNVMFCPRRWL